MEIGTIAFLLLIGSMLLLYPKPANRSSAENFDLIADKPFSFGSMCSWIAVPISESDCPLIDSLKFEEFRSSNWKAGFEAISTNRELVFVSPVLDGWQFIIGFGIPDPAASQDSEKTGFSQLMQSLSDQYGSAFYFLSHSGAGVYSWSSFKNGSELRTYYHYQKPLRNFGTVTEVEKALGLKFEEGQSQDSKVGEAPEESHVIQVASRWTMNPMKLHESKVEGVGHLVKF